MIPKTLHLTSSDFNSLPPVVVSNIHHLQSLNPGWTIRQYDDRTVEDYLASQIDDRLLSAFKRIHPAYGAAKADLFRYVVIYNEGGVYLDIKSTMTRPLDAFIKPDDELLLSHWDNGRGAPHENWGMHPEVAELPGGEYQQWHIISESRSPLIASVIELCLENISGYRPEIHGIGRMATLRTTGPICYTLGILRAKGMGSFRMIDAQKEGLVYRAPGLKPGEAFYSQSGLHYSEATVPLTTDWNLKVKC